MNQRGQIAIFVALIFQVLFVFFAMIINVGLLVHDKINLQNSVDLAAYYGAQRQAEVLNAIAHTNYQIRQAWKLLAWRIHVVGDAGRSGHSLATPGAAGGNETDSYGGGRYPTICVNHSLFAEVAPGVTGSQQNVCYIGNFQLPKLPKVETVAGTGFLSAVNQQITNMTENWQNKISDQCFKYGPINWLIAANWLTRYKFTMYHRMEAIYRLAARLSAPSPIDIAGQSVDQGIEATFTNNLTRTNRASFAKGGQFRVHSSMRGVDPKVWLRKMSVLPIVPFTNYNSSSPGNCKVSNQSAQGSFLYDPSGVVAKPNGVDPNDFAKFAPYIYEGRPINDPWHTAVGVEKNPWYQAYIGVYAESEPRKPFAPLGVPIKLKAMGFAKPFGGRVGPWFYSTWPAGSLSSAGGAPVDANLYKPTQFGGSSTSLQKAIPNYARFPGDQLGMRSTYAAASFRKGILTPGTITSKIRFDYWIQSSLGVGTDPLAWSHIPQLNNDIAQPPRGPWIRNFEVAAIAPDLFDATYYSIDPRWRDNYPDSAAAMDLGDRLPGKPPFSVKRQVEVANQLIDRRFNYWKLSSWQHLLNSWVSDGYGTYPPTSGKLGRCPTEAKLPVPGGCIDGGRTGYSVKIVSYEYLKDNIVFAGDGTEPGPLINQPPQWKPEESQ